MAKYKNIITIILAIVILLSLTGCSVIHTCDQCGKTFAGTSYYAYSLFSDDKLTLCEECARTYYYPFPYKQFAN